MRANAQGIVSHLGVRSPEASLFEPGRPVRHGGFVSSFVDLQVPPTERATVVVPRTADALHRVTVSAAIDILRPPPGAAPLPEFPLEVAIDEVRVLVGGTPIDRLDASVFRVYDELFRTDEQRAAYRRAACIPDFERREVERLATREAPADGSAVLARRVLQLPLVFWFNENAADSLPLSELIYHEVEFELKFRSNQYLKERFGFRLDRADVRLSAELVHLLAETRLANARGDRLAPHPASRPGFVATDRSTDERESTERASTRLIPVKLWNSTTVDMPDRGSATKVQLDHHGDLEFVAWFACSGDGCATAAVNCGRTPEERASEAFSPLCPDGCRVWIDGYKNEGFVDARTGASAAASPVAHASSFRSAPRSAGLHVHSFALAPCEPHRSGALNVSMLEQIAVELKSKTESTGPLLSNDRTHTLSSADVLSHVAVVSRSRNYLASQIGMMSLLLGRGQPLDRLDPRVA